MSVQTALTGPIGDVERDGDVVSLPNGFDFISDFEYRPRWLVSENLIGEIGTEVSLPAVPVRPADSAGLDVDHDTVFLCTRSFDITYLEWFTDAL
jgi:hypothetical protein